MVLSDPFVAMKLGDDFLREGDPFRDELAQHRPRRAVDGAQRKLRDVPVLHAFWQPEYSGLRAEVAEYRKDRLVLLSHRTTTATRILPNRVLAGVSATRTARRSRRRDAPSVPLQIFFGSDSPFLTSLKRSHFATRPKTTVLRSVGGSSAAVEFQKRFSVS